LLTSQLLHVGDIAKAKEKTGKKRYSLAETRVPHPNADCAFVSEHVKGGEMLDTRQNIDSARP
jgi:hypothetical protein